MTLCFDSNQNKIYDENGRELSIDEARQLWESGQIEDCNLSFKTLAFFDFDFEKVDEYYTDLAMAQ
jgi:hypothetical protein